MLTLIVALAAVAPGQFSQGLFGGDAALEAKVEAALARLTLEEKIELLGGVDGFYTHDIPKANLPRLKMSDGPVGVRNDGPTTAYPAGFTLAASWDPELVRRFGVAIGRDARARGVHIWLGPGVNPARVMQNGRNFEYMGEDPFLAGTLASEVVKGVQSQGVVATVKHFAGNEHESDRNNDDSIIDERTLREIYLKPFEIIVKKGGVAALMSSYNLVNGQHASENRHLLTEILKNEWGFKGLVMSDWGSVYSANGPYQNGLDLEMPDARWMNKKNLLEPIRSGALPQSDLDDKVRRLLRVAYAMKFDERPQQDKSVSLDDPANAKTAIEAAAEGMVLLKNDHNVLPLKASRILVVGPNADPAVTGGGGSAYTTPNRAVSLRNAMADRKPASVTIDYTPGVTNDAAAARQTSWTELHADYFAGTKLEGTPLLSRTETRIDNRWRRAPAPGLPAQNFSVRWTGTYTPKQTGKAVLSVRVDDGIRVNVDGKRLIDEWHDQGTTSYSAPLETTAGKPMKIEVEYYQGGGEAVAQVGIAADPESEMETTLPKDKVAGYDAIVACVGFTGTGQPYEGEGSDRSWTLPAEQEAMLRRLVSLNKNVIVVLNAGAGVATEGWIGKAAGFVHAGYPGGEGNLALADLLYGRRNFEGKLPTSFPAKLEGTYYEKAYPSHDRKMVYNETLFMGYRWFDAAKVKPLYPFGYGLSYTNFKVGKASASSGDTIHVSATVENVGGRPGAEVVQVYSEPPKVEGVARAVRELRAFQKVRLGAHETKSVDLTFSRSDLARYDVAKKAWVVDPGVYKLRIGTSSRDLSLTVSVTIP